MILQEISLKKSLNKAYRLIKPKRPDIELFKGNLINLLGQIDEKESEENVKIHLMDFLKDTWYKQDYLVATKGRTDFVIHTGKEAKTPSGVLFEVKRPTNKGDMVTRQNLNAKAMHELILYYLRERVNEKNIDIRHLVITNIYEWFIFDATIFEKVVAKNTKLVKAFKDWDSGQKVSTNTDLFYNEDKESSESFLLIPNALRRFVEIYTLLLYPDLHDSIETRLYKLLEEESLITAHYAKLMNHFSHFTTMEKIGKHDELILNLPDAVKQFIDLLQKNDRHYNSLKRAINK